MTSPQLPRKAHIIGCLYRTCRSMRSSYLHMQPTTHLDPRMYACLQACIMRAAVEFYGNPDPIEVTPLPGIYFFDGWRVRPCINQARDILAKAIRNQAEDGLSTWGQQFDHKKYFFFPSLAFRRVYVLETHSSTTSRSRPPTWRESIRG